MVEERVGHQLVGRVLLPLGVNQHLVSRPASGTSRVTGSFFENVAVSPNGVAEGGIPDAIYRFAFYLISYGTFIKKRTIYC